MLHAVAVKSRWKTEPSGHVFQNNHFRETFMQVLFFQIYLELVQMDKLCAREEAGLDIRASLVTDKSHTRTSAGAPL